SASVGPYTHYLDDAHRDFARSLYFFVPLAPSTSASPFPYTTLFRSELDPLTGVRPLEHSGEHHAPARPGPIGDLLEVPAQNVVAGVAAVAPELGRDVVGPRLAEQVAVVPRLGRPPLDLELRQCGAGRGDQRVRRRRRGRGVVP